MTVTYNIEVVEGGFIVTRSVFRSNGQLDGGCDCTRHVFTTFDAMMAYLKSRLT